MSKYGLRPNYKQINVDSSFNLPQLPSLAASLDWEGLRTDRLGLLMHYIGDTCSGMTRYRTELKSSLARELCLRRTRGAIPSPLDAATVVISRPLRPQSPLVRAATLVAAFHDIYRLISATDFVWNINSTRQEAATQYFNFFGTQLDVIQPGHLVGTGHPGSIIAMWRGRPFIIDYDSSRSIEDLAGLFHSAFTRIVTPDKHSYQAIPSIGHIGACTPSTQRSCFDYITKTRAGRDAVARLQTAFLTVALDLDNMTDDAESMGRLAQIDNCGNRWYPSSCQVVISGSADAALVCAFSAYIDGNAMSRMAHELWLRSAHVNAPTDDNATGYQIVTVPLNIDKRLLERAASETRRLVDDGHSQYTYNIGRSVTCGCRAITAGGSFVSALYLSLLETIRTAWLVRQYLSQEHLRYGGVRTLACMTPEMASFLSAAHADSTDLDLARLLDSAISAHQRRIDAARNHLSRSILRNMFYGRASKSQRLRLEHIEVILARLLYKNETRRWSCLISHPRPYAGVELFGRPGLRLPYDRTINIHYAIDATQTRIVVCASRNFDRDVFAKHLETSLRRISSLPLN